MRAQPSTMSGRQLWRLLPEIYRQRDDSGDLANYLDGFGVLLDKIYANLRRRLRDTSPLDCQPWLIPYFADLLDVRLVSPDVDGQRLEVARAVDWRKRKGTIEGCVEIAEAVGRAVIIPQEGHTRVATTARIGVPLLSLEELGEDDPPDRFGTQFPRTAARRPGVPAVTVYFRKVSHPRRVKAEAPTAHSRKTVFGQEGIEWQPANPPYGVPCRVNGYQDVSVRTVDMRTPAWDRGHHHPKRLLLHTPVPEGFFFAERPSPSDDQFDPSRPVLSWETVQKICEPAKEDPAADQWQERHDGSEYCWRSFPLGVFELIEERLRSISEPPDESIRRTLVFNPQGATDQKRSDWNDPWPGSAFVLQMQFSRSKEDGAWDAAISGGCQGQAKTAAESDPAKGPHLRPDPRLPTFNDTVTLDESVAPGELQTCRIEDLVFLKELKVPAPVVMLERVAVRKFSSTVDTTAKLTAKDTLLDEISAAFAECELEYCTVRTLASTILRASDCILLAELPENLERLRLRYCCAPHLPTTLTEDWVVDNKTSRRQPLFHVAAVKDNVSNTEFGKPVAETTFGRPGCPVLHPATHAGIRFGAEDGGEIGAYHHRHYARRAAAVVDKLGDFLPAGIEPVLIVDDD